MTARTMMNYTNMEKYIKIIGTMKVVKAEKIMNK